MMRRGGEGREGVMGGRAWVPVQLLGGRVVAGEGVSLLAG